MLQINTRHFQLPHFVSATPERFFHILNSGFDESINNLLRYAQFVGNLVDVGGPAATEMPTVYIESGTDQHITKLLGAKLTEMHPISTLPPSNLLNITLVSYADKLFFGLIATDHISHLERLSTYIEEAFTELEDAVLDAHSR